jgi:hypothetical protein
MDTTTQQGDGNIITRDIINSEVQVMVGTLNEDQRNDTRVIAVLEQIHDFEQKLVNTRKEHEQRRLLLAINTALEQYAFALVIALWIIGMFAMLNQLFFTIVTVTLPVALVVFSLYQYYKYIRQSARRRTLMKQYKRIIHNKKEELSHVVRHMQEAV